MHTNLKAKHVPSKCTRSPHTLLRPDKGTVAASCVVVVVAAKLPKPTSQKLPIPRPFLRPGSSQRRRARRCNLCAFVRSLSRDFSLRTGLATTAYRMSFSHTWEVVGTVRYSTLLNYSLLLVTHMIEAWHFFFVFVSLSLSLYLLFNGHVHEADLARICVWYGAILEISSSSSCILLHSFFNRSYYVQLVKKARKKMSLVFEKHAGCQVQQPVNVDGCRSTDVRHTPAYAVFPPSTILLCPSQPWGSSTIPRHRCLRKGGASNTTDLVYPQVIGISRRSSSDLVGYCV